MGIMKWVIGFSVCLLVTAGFCYCLVFVFSYYLWDLCLGVRVCFHV